MQAAQRQKQLQLQLDFYQQQAARALQARDEAQASLAAQAEELDSLRSNAHAHAEERRKDASALQRLRMENQRLQQQLGAAEDKAAKVPELQSALSANQDGLAREQRAHKGAQVLHPCCGLLICFLTATCTPGGADRLAPRCQITLRAVDGSVR